MLWRTATTLAMTAHAGIATYLALILGACVSASVIAETLNKSTDQPTLRADPLWEQEARTGSYASANVFSARPASSSEHLGINTVERKSGVPP